MGLKLNFRPRNGVKWHQFAKPQAKPAAGAHQRLLSPCHCRAALQTAYLAISLMKWGPLELAEIAVDDLCKATRLFRNASGFET